MSPTGHEPTHPATNAEENASQQPYDAPADPADRRTAEAGDPDSAAGEQGAADGVQAPLDPAARERARARAEAIAFKAQDRQNRAKARTLTNMFWALLATFVVVAFLMIVTWRPKEEKVRAVEYTAQLEDARKVASWVRGPEPMPEGWTATNVEFRAPEQSPITWHLGTVTGEKKYVGLEQSNQTSPRYQNDELGKTEDDGTSTVGGVVWQRRTLVERKDEQALVLVGSGVTTIVTGNAGYPALETFAATLR
ncbi:DUF4245 domain-containing protein [Kribbella sp. DT2]|uniref:DUF4245 domain-containing protein n=1 Tax=Kribbella sp. DT2 TaxID=3393427 RepID=UPI003CF5A7AB